MFLEEYDSEGRMVSVHNIDMNDDRYQVLEESDSSLLQALYSSDSIAPVYEFCCEMNSQAVRVKQIILDLAGNPAEDAVMLIQAAFPHGRYSVLG